MTMKLRSRSAIAAISGGILVIGGVAVAPALAYPPGQTLTIACNKTVYAPGETANCTLTNTNPAGPNDIVLGARLGAQGAGVGFSWASLGAQAAGTFSKSLTMPNQTGTYEVVGTSASETATTTVRVVAGGATAFSLTVNANGSVTVQGGTTGCTVTVLVNGKSAGTGTVGADGTVTINANAPTGATVTATQTASDTCAALEAAPVVAGGGGAGGGGGTTGGGQPTTPDTGANVALGLLAGIGALGVGGGLYAASRRKRV